MIINYDTGEFPFAREIEERFRAKFGGYKLTRLHLYQDYSLRCRENDWQTMYHEYFYELARESWFHELYRGLIARVVASSFASEEWIAYQVIPSFRVHLPDNLAVGEFHRDTDYSHPETEVNFWLPLTEARDTSVFWVESQSGLGDYAPAAKVLQPGEIFQFDGAHLRHGDVLNKTGLTRVSFDFRIIPGSLYQGSEKKTINSGMRYVLGEYYARMEQK
ncbi:MAG: hypothetical protein AAB845_00575 [Patescibacteria group bacterium]